MMPYISHMQYSWKETTLHNGFLVCSLFNFYGLCNHTAGRRHSLLCYVVLTQHVIVYMVSKPIIFFSTNDWHSLIFLWDVCSKINHKIKQDFSFKYGIFMVLIACQCQPWVGSATFSCCPITSTMFWIFLAGTRSHFTGNNNKTLLLKGFFFNRGPFSKAVEGKVK